MAPVKIRSGKYIDCQDLCSMVEDDSNIITLTQFRCVWFIFFKPEFEGPLSSHCVLFDEKLYEKKLIYMKNVISGLGKPKIIHLGPH